MRLKIDRSLAHQAALVNRVDDDDVRRYYLLDDCLLVLRNSLEILHLAGQVVDARVGWDVARPGFCREQDVGKRRTKITIHRTLRVQQYDHTLRQILANTPQHQEEN